MSDAAPRLDHSLALQKQSLDSSRQPLEVYHLSHDLRGPLNSILGFAELLLEEIEGPLTENQQADIAAIYQSAQNLLHLINTVVDLSKLEANRLVLDLKPVALPEVIEAVWPSIAAAKPEQIELSFNLQPNLPPVRADRERLGQMLKDLLRMAFKMTKKGPLLLTVESSSSEVVLRLEIGQTSLPEAEIADLFQLMVKVDATGRSALGRGGLELPLVRYLAEKQQGRVWAETHSNATLVIFISLPAAI